MKLLLLGANGFIGSNLSAHILKTREWEIHAMDIATDKLSGCLAHPRFHFKQGDITQHLPWIETHIRQCDVVLPLVAIATPATYVKDPLAVFELDFEANLAIVRMCVKHKKRLIFPSSSEVYGINADAPYDEETSNLVTGPITKERWIYASAKQLMDRVIHAYGHQGLQFTLFRPFNWFGPNLDNVWNPQKPSRVVAQFLSNIFHRHDIVLVGDGQQKRCFLYIDDALDALIKIIENNNHCADGRIFNIGHPGNEISIADLAKQMLKVMTGFKGYENIQSHIRITTSHGDDYYGKGYQDIPRRVPNIENAKKYLGWKPTIDLHDGIRRTIEFYYSQRPIT